MIDDIVMPLLKRDASRRRNEKYDRLMPLRLRQCSQEATKTMSTIKNVKSAITWFEIPVVDMKRAVAFYQAVLGGTLKSDDAPGMQQSIFPYQVGDGVGGALVRDERRKPSANGGVTVYLPVDAVELATARAQKAGGKIVLDKTDIGDPGFIALVVDSEGNTVGLHAEKPRS
jgi:hypothetical protein